jgi:hypothetical protein
MNALAPTALKVVAVIHYTKIETLAIGTKWPHDAKCSPTTPSQTPPSILPCTLDLVTLMDHSQPLWASISLCCARSSAHAGSSGASPFGFSKLWVSTPRIPSHITSLSPVSKWSASVHTYLQHLLSIRSVLQQQSLFIHMLSGAMTRFRSHERINLSLSPSQASRSVPRYAMNI